MMLTPSLLMAPISILLGSTWAANLFLLLSFWMIAFCVYRLAIQRGFSKWEALGSGLLAQTFPYLLGYPLASGVYERLECWIFPFLIIGLESYHKNGQIKWLIGSAVALLFVAFSCQTYVVFATLLLLLYFPMVPSRRSAFFIGFLGLILFGSFLFIRYVAQSPWTLSPQPMRFSLFASGPMVEESTNLAALFSPWYIQSQKGVESGDWLLRLSYVGWIPLILCIRALYKRSIAWSIVALGILFIVLSLGTKVTTVPVSIPNLPYLLFAYTLPAYGSIPDSFQQVAVALPFISMGAIAGLRGFSPKIAVSLLALCFVERALVLPHDQIWQTSSTVVPTIYQKIQDGPVLDIPRQYKGKQLVSAAPFGYQRLHQQPIGFSVYMGVTGWDAYAPIASGVSSDWNAAVRCMRKGGIRWLVVHKNWFAESSAADTIRAKLSIKPIWDDGERLLYDLSTLNISPMKDVYLPPRNTGLPETRPEEEILDPDIFSMQQTKCPIDSAARHRPGPQ
ncbi:MAG: hypothetical protein VX278_11230 [Myxococcota bacterium]|nr:hypothetical protein [Myxococcota bacterium]